MKRFSGENRLPINRIVHNLLYRIGANWRSFVLVAGCIALFFAAGKLNFAFAVNMDGDLLGYVSSREELDSIVDGVQQSVSEVLGYEWDAPALTCRVTLGVASPESEEQVAGKLLESVTELQELNLVYVDGEAVCAFETRDEALYVLKNLYRSYQTTETESIYFLQNVTVATATADKRLLEDRITRLSRALDVVTVETKVEEKLLCYHTLLVEDPDLFTDEGYIRTEGVDGLDTTTYRITRVNGSITETETVDFERISPVTEVVIVGTKERHSTGSYAWPCKTGWITSGFGVRHIELGSTNHQGIDIGADLDTPIYAADGGEVIFAGEYKSYGNLVKIQHDNGDVTYYAHCNRILVTVGEYVTQGEEIALMGSTGVSTGPHLHFELRPGGGNAVNPISYLPADGLTYLN